MASAPGYGRRDASILLQQRGVDDTPRRYTDIDLLSGSSRMRFPVSAKMAFAIAGATGGTPGSPPPPGAAVLSTRSTDVRRGASLIRTIRPPPRKLSCSMAPPFMVIPPYNARLIP